MNTLKIGELIPRRNSRNPVDEALYVVKLSRPIQTQGQPQAQSFERKREREYRGDRDALKKELSRGQFARC